MDKSTTPIDWRTVLRDQGRTIGWLADRTGRPRRTVYSYAQGRLSAPREWLAQVAAILGVEIADEIGPELRRERARAELGETA